MISLKKSTKPIKAKQIKREWHLVDVKSDILGRSASKIAQLLIGKHKVNYVPYLDSGDNVVVINASKVEVTGRKAASKVYARYSGHPGGLKKIGFKTMKKDKPEEIIRHAVHGMIPKNKLRKERMKRLHIFADDKHSYESQLSSEK